MSSWSQTWVQSWRVGSAVGWVTFREVIRDKVLYNVIVTAVLLFGVSYLASRLAFGRAERVVLDFGLAAVSLSCGMIGALIGAGLLGREIERRTIHVALSRPISRLQFVFGKFLGLLAVIGVNWALLVGTYLGMLALQTESLGEIAGFTLAAALILALFQSLVLGAIAILFSTVTTTSLSVILTTGIYLIGINVSEIRWLAARAGSPVSSTMLNGVARAFPDFGHFNLGLKVTYDLPVSFGFFATSVLYALALVLFCLLFAGTLIRTRDV